jgi:hypothetical protein
MQEQIRYAWGKSSLGEFIAAVSDVGLLACGLGFIVLDASNFFRTSPLRWASASLPSRSR